MSDELCENVDIMKKIFKSFSLIVKYLSKYLLDDIEGVLNNAYPLYTHENTNIRILTCRSLSLLIHCCKTKKLKKILLYLLSKYMYKSDIIHGEKYSGLPNFNLI